MFYQESRCGYVVCLVGLLWATEALPLPITSLIPVVLLPLLGLLTTDEVSIQYMLLYCCDVVVLL